jgi:hypothetical protein
MCIIIIGTMLSTPTTMPGRCLHWLTSHPRLPARHWLPATNPFMKKSEVLRDGQAKKSPPSAGRPRRISNRFCASIVTDTL